MTQESREKLAPRSLDPDDWSAWRSQGHRMLDDMFDYLETLRERPVWRPVPAAVREQFAAPLPHEPAELADIHDTFMESILPYAVGNAHPGFMGWVHGGGTAIGMLAEMLAGGLNANLGGRDQIPVAVERQVVDWVRTLVAFPDQANGLFVTGTSIANYMAVLAARNWALGDHVRARGVVGEGASLTAYTSTSAHGCIAQAMDMAGLGTDRLRRVPVDSDYRVRVETLRAAVETDRNAGLHPFLIVATAGTVDVGAIDDLQALADLADEQRLWLHVDGALGVLAKLSPRVAPRLAGLDRAMSLAFDFHKWGQVPYDAGFLLVREGRRLQSTFSDRAAYLQRYERGLAGGAVWPCDLGPDLSRGFRALKTWFTLQVYGTERLAQTITQSCDLAQALAQRIGAEPELELMAPVSLNIVCFRYRCENADTANAAIAADVQESGISAPSTIQLEHGLAIRAALVNHRTRRSDIHALVDAVLAFGRSRTNGRHQAPLEMET